MLTIGALEARREAIGGDASLQALLARVRARVTPVLQGLPVVPQVKAMLSQDGGICPEDRTALQFDPWQPESHRCPTCGTAVTGERHHAHWARAQHLWLAERMLDLATLAALEEDRAAAGRAVDLIAAYDDLYFALPNRDNVLGPTHLFFSTYLESIWVTNYVAAAFLLREVGVLPDERVEGVNHVAEEAAALIGEFNEGLSNRQTWHAAALTAVAAWFGDEELAQTTIESRTGLLGHLADGFGEDGLWIEGENYHLFALRGLMVGLGWARTMGIDLLEDPELREHYRAALLAPSRTALPDLTYPARKDSRYGVSLAQPASLEMWEIGRAWLGDDAELDAWLAALYAAPAPPADHYDAWLHDAGFVKPERRTRSDLSAWALLEIGPAPARQTALWRGESAFLATQGLAVLRQGDRYVSLECGNAGGGHGHPDRLNLTLHAGGVHWLPDPGTGSYVEEALAWYRSPMAHNAPILDGWSPGSDDVRCEAFDVKGGWGWVRGRAGEVSRTIIAGPDHLLDIVELEAKASRRLVLPWHLIADTTVLTGGRWEPADLEEDQVTGVERFIPESAGPITLSATGANGARLGVHLLGGGELYRAMAPGLPTERKPRVFYLEQVQGVSARLVAVLDDSAAGPAVSAVRVGEGEIEVTRPGGATRYRFTPTGVTVASATGTVDLAGLRPAPLRPAPLFEERTTWDAIALAPHAWGHLGVNGTLEGFDDSEPLELSGEHKYRRSEEPYDESFMAQAWVNWDQEALYLGVVVTKPDIVISPADAPPLNLDNEPDDIHSDGIQVYLRLPDKSLRSFVITLGEDNDVRVRPIAGSSGDAGAVTGAWSDTGEGYCLTVRLAEPVLATLREGARLGFDLLVNEARADRMRRAGQLVWSGGGGWVYLRGDRQPESGFGVLELA
jgi:hypothetical protein